MIFAACLSLLLKVDAGVPLPRPLKAEDPELVKNLELLELMDETADLDLLQELAVER